MDKILQNFTLSAIIGRCLSETSGLTYAHLPYGLHQSFAEEIVSAANLQVSAQKDAGQFAFLVNGGPTEKKTELCTNLSERDSLRYRQCNHLMVLSDRQPDLASFNNVFRQTMSAGYPLDTSEELSFQKVAASYVQSIFTLYGWSDPILQDEATTRIVYCLQTISDIFQSEESRSIPWNTTWFAHASNAFTTLQQKLQGLMMDSPGTISRRDFFARYTCPSFGLPGNSDVAKLNATRFRRAWDAYWSDESEINSSIRKLAHHPEVISTGLPHPLESISFERFSEWATASDSGFYAFSSIVNRSDVGVSALSHLTVSQFLRPEGPGADSFLTIRSLHGPSLQLPNPESDEPFFVELYHQAVKASSSRVRVEIPVLRPPSASAVRASRAKIQASGRTYSWVGELVFGEDGRLFAEGVFVRKMNASRPSMKFTTVGIYVDIPNNDPLSGYLGHPTCRVCFYPSESEFAVYAVASSRVVKYKYVGPDNMFESTALKVDRGEFVRDLVEGSNARKYRIAVINAGRPGAIVSLNGAPIRPSSSDSQFTVFELVPSGWDVINGRSTAYIFRQTGAKGQQSPLHAAISNESISSDPPDSSEVRSFRGVVEQYYSDNSGSTDLIDSLGHIFLAAEVDTGIKCMKKLDENTALIPGASKLIWERNNLFDVPDHFIRGAAAARFREAFAALKMPEMVSKIDKDESSYNELISKLSYAELPQRAVVEYVEAYANLVEAAVATEDSSAIYWAAYPMSVSIWGTEAEYGVQATFLSPWHPLRLSWLAGAEATLREARYAERLAGLVEGWNFPYVGPRETSNSRSIAVPMDSARDQLFLGWSLMVPVAVDRYQPLKVPERAAGMDLPGTATSGLNGQAATAALASYKSMRPHLSTLTIDLAAQQNTPRLKEIDAAVLNLARKWSRDSKKGGGQAIGGLRVLDSLKRIGDVPTDDVRDLVRSDPDLLITWSRYSPHPVESKQSNIRLLQDAGTRQYVSRGSRKEGSAGPIPLRRFGGPFGSKNGPRAGSHFAPSIKNAHTPFMRAVEALENVYGTPEISSMIFNTPFGDGTADWTVSGESMMGPAALASLLGAAKSAGENAHMLWEWRPPMFESVGTAVELERRPYVSVAKVPLAFEAQIIRALKGTSPLGPENAARDLIATLGTRGVGLSRLLSQGGTHVSGAIGFYTAFKALQLLHPLEEDQFVIPLDAADSFLNAMAGNDGASRTERADLLIIRLNDQSLVLSPVEIKCYGLSSTNPPTQLPLNSAGVFRKANNQLEATKRLLEGLAAEYDSARQRSQADLLLWTNALTALLEVGVRLQPVPQGTTSNNERLAERLSSCAGGKVSIEVGRPIVLYFQDTQGLDPDHKVSYLNAHDEDAMVGVMISDLSHALTSSALDGSKFTSALSGLVDWSTGSNESFSSTTATPKENETPDAREALIEDGPEMGEEMYAKHAALLDSEKKGIAPAPDADTSGITIQGEGVRFSLGYTLDTVGLSSVDHWPSNTEMTQMNLGVVGDLGTGKTEFLKAYISRMRSVSSEVQKNPISFLIFDYKGDFQDESFLHNIGGRTLMPREMPINVFSRVTPEHNKQPYQQAAAFVDILRKIYSGVGVVQSEALNTVVRQLFEEKNGEPPTLSQVRDAYSALIGKPDSVLSILNGFVYGNIFGDDETQLRPFADVLDGDVLVVALDKLGTDENMKNALVAMFLNLYYDYMITSEKVPFTGSDPQLRHLNSFLVVDEAVNIMKYEFPALMNLMLQGRQFGMGVVLASQYLSHFRTAGTNYGQPLSSWVIHKVPAVTHKELEQLGLPQVPQVVASRIPRLGRHEVLYKSFGSEEGVFARVTPYYEL